MAYARNWSASFQACTAICALATAVPVKAQGDFAAKRDKLIKTIDSLNAKADPAAPWKYTMKLTPTGRRVEVRMTSNFAPDTPNRVADGKVSVQTFTLPGPYTFEAQKGAGSRFSNMVSVHGKENWNVGNFKTEGLAQQLARALSDLNQLCATYAEK
jgi:hypothetical protein